MASKKQHLKLKELKKGLSWPWDVIIGRQCGLEKKNRKKQKKK